MNARCPDCHDGFGELLAKRSGGDEVVATFECAACGYEWSVTL
jgi:DNA-directed RNA polymerase subunit M/transcription elongation factor TFIIS